MTRFIFNCIQSNHSVSPSLKQRFHREWEKLNYQCITLPFISVFKILIDHLAHFLFYCSSVGVTALLILSPIYIERIQLYLKNLPAVYFIIYTFGKSFFACLTIFLTVKGIYILPLKIYKAVKKQKDIIQIQKNFLIKSYNQKGYYPQYELKKEIIKNGCSYEDKGMFYCPVDGLPIENSVAECLCLCSNYKKCIKCDKLKNYLRTD